MSRYLRVAMLVAPVLLWAAVAVFALTGQSRALGAADDEQPKLSSFAPAEDLLAEADDLATALEEDVADEQTYKRKKKSASRDAHTLAIIAHAIANHDKADAVKWAANAAFVRDAARAFAKADDYAAAQAAISQVKDLMGGAKPDGQAEQLEWNEVAPLGEIMNVVQRRSLFVGRGLRPRRLARSRPETVRHATLLSLIGHLAQFDLHEVKDDADVPQWQEYAQQMRTEFAKLASLVRQEQDDQLKAARSAANKSCKSCHEKFRPDIE